MPKSEVYNCDCMTFMQGLKDNAFDLCIADPPYGIDIQTSGTFLKKMNAGHDDWDASAPDKEWFDELQRVCDHFILWGANHYIDRIPICSKAWVIWDKQIPEAMSFAMCEMALTNFNTKTAKIFRYSPMKQNAEEIRIHPTQKPIALYEWLLKNYAPQGG